MSQEIAECAFEPDATDILCSECDKPIGMTGTCRDVGICESCRADWIELLGEQGFSEMLISMIEGRGYRSKFMPRRSMHYGTGGIPLCGARNNQKQPTTVKRAEVTCKRCLTHRIPA